MSFLMSFYRKQHVLKSKPFPQLKFIKVYDMMEKKYKKKIRVVRILDGFHAHNTEV